METRACAAYNLAKGILLNSRLTIADCACQPLRILNLMVGGLGLDSESGLWLLPLVTVPGVPRVFPFDLIYLDRDYRVVETAEMGPGIEFPRYREQIASALVLPLNTLKSTQTEPGDQLIVCPADELNALLSTAVVAVPEQRKSLKSSDFAPSAEPKPHARDKVPLSDRPGDHLESRSLVEQNGNRAFDSTLKPKAASQPKAQTSAPPASDSLPNMERPKTPVEDSIPTQRSTGRKADSADNQPPRIIPQRIANSLAFPSTTTFAKSSLPLWHVSAPTAVAPVVVSPKPAPAATKASGRQGTNAVRTGNPRPSEARTTGDPTPKKISSPSPLPSGVLRNPAEPSASETLKRNPAMSQNQPPSKSIQPKPDPPRRMWPKVPVANDLSNWKSTSPNANRDLELKPATVEPERGMDAEPPLQREPASAANEHALKVLLPRFLKLEQQGKLKALPDTDRGSDLLLAGLRSKFKRWLKPAAHPSDRRKAQRRYVPEMVAHYFTGGAPKPHQVADISMTGFYLLTEDRWMTGTIIQMTLQRPCAKGHQKQSITVLSRIVRGGSDGVAGEFVMSESIDSQTHDLQPSKATDRFALARFL